MRQTYQPRSEEERLERFFAQLERVIPEPPPGWLRDALPPGSTTKTRGHRGHLIP